MATHSYKVLALHLPGTLTDETGRITPENKQSLLSLQEQNGVRVVLIAQAPNELPDKLSEELRLADFSGYLITFGGALVSAARGQRTLTCKTFSDATLSSLKQEPQLKGQLLLLSAQAVFAEPLTPSTNAQTKLPGIPFRPIQEHRREEIYQVLFYPQEGSFSAAEELLNDRFQNELRYITHPQEGYIDIRPVGVSNANALRYLLDRLDFRPEELIAVGNAPEHIEVIQMAGLGVATANAPELVKSCAEYITLSPQESGIAHLIEKYIEAPLYEQVPYSAEQANALMPDTLMGTLGMRCKVLAKGYVEMTMPVDRRTRQPMGIVHGGASLALAETAAGIGSAALIEPDEMLVGVQVSGNHIASTPEGDTLCAKSSILHKGHNTHLWSVEIYSTKSGKLICSCRVLNAILHKR